MSKDFEQIGHKNIELLRFYISKDISKINKKIKDNDNQLTSSLIASLIDILIVIIFSDDFKNSSRLSKIVWIVFLVVFFLIATKVISKIRNAIVNRRKETGKDKYKLEVILERIDEFDNIACDGLLICQNYKSKFSAVSETYLKSFYFFEIIHHLKKIVSIFECIRENPELYIDDNDERKLDTYRVNNFIIFAKEINKFVQSQKISLSDDKNLADDISNINAQINKWVRYKIK